MAAEPRRVASDEPRGRGAERRWLPTALGLAGAVMLFLGWWGASGVPTVAEQLPYIASGSIPGAALVAAAAVLLARDSAPRDSRRTDELIAQLHSLLVEGVPDAPVAALASPAAPTAAAATGLVALPTGELYHSSECVLVAGKAGVEQVDSQTIASRRLSPCHVCEPGRPAA
jgi:drug/metabolite transporter (DMT)-like permease